MTESGNRLVRDGAWVFTGRVISAVSGLLVVALVARLLEAEDVGHYFLYFSLVSILALIAQLGLNLAVVRLIAEHVGHNRHAHAASVVTLSVKLVSFAALSLSVVLVLFVYFYPQYARLRIFDDGYLVAALVAWFCGTTMQGLVAECLRGYHRVREASIYGVVISAVLSALILAVLWFSGTVSSLLHVIGVMAATVVLSVLVGGLRLRREMAAGDGMARTGTTELLSLAWPMWSTNITLLILTQADIWIIGSFLSVDDVAIYGSAARMIIVISISLAIVNAVIAPEISRLYHRDELVVLGRRLRTATAVAVFPSVCALLVFYFYGEALLDMVFGSWYRDAYPVLMILGTGQLFNVMAGPCGMTLLMTGYQQVMMNISIITSIGAIVASICAAMYWGMLGVAVVFSVSLIIQNLLMNHYLVKHTGISTFFDFRSLLRSP